MEQQTDVGTEIVVVIQAVIVLLVTAQALPDLLKRRLARRQADTSRKQSGTPHAKAGAR